MKTDEYLGGVPCVCVEVEIIVPGERVWMAIEVEAVPSVCVTARTEVGVGVWVEHERVVICVWVACDIVLVCVCVDTGIEEGLVVWIV